MAEPSAIIKITFDELSVEIKSFLTVLYVLTISLTMLVLSKIFETLTNAITSFVSIACFKRTTLEL